MKKNDVQSVIKREKFEFVKSNYLWYSNFSRDGTQWLICLKHTPFQNLKETIVYPVAMERAPFYLTNDGTIAFNIHLAKRFVERALGEDPAQLTVNENVCRFATNVGKAALLCNIPAERRCVYRVKHGLLLCATDKANGIPFANTFISDRDFFDDQREAVAFFDAGKTVIASHKYQKLYFRNKHKIKNTWNQ